MSDHRDKTNPWIRLVLVEILPTDDWHGKTNRTTSPALCNFTAQKSINQSRLHCEAVGNEFSFGLLSSTTNRSSISIAIPYIGDYAWVGF